MSLPDTIKFRNAVYVTAQAATLESIEEKLLLARKQLSLAQPGAPRDSLTAAVAGTGIWLEDAIRTLRRYIRDREQDKELAARIEQERLDDEAFAKEGAK